MASNLASPHPLLKQPALYVPDPPGRPNAKLRWEDIQKVINQCGSIRSGGHLSDKSRSWWLVLFEDLFHAELALVTLQGTTVPGMDPPYQLRLYHSSDFEEPFPKSRLLPQFVKSSVPFHPVLQTATLKMLFAYFRNAGPLAFLEKSVNIGYPEPVIVVEYWDEEHANHARQRGKNIHEDLQQSPAFTLRTFDSCNLYCAMLGPTVQTQDMYTIFGKYGKIDAVRMIKSGIPDSFGFVSYFDPFHAIAAIHDLNGKRLPGGTTTLVVRCHEPGNQKVVRARTTVLPSFARPSSTAPSTSSTSTSTNPQGQTNGTAKPNGTSEADAKQKAEAAARAEAAAKAAEARKAEESRRAREAEEETRREETRKRRLSRQQRREHAQVAERLARQRREEAVSHAEAQKHLHRLSRAACEVVERKLTQAERNCQEAKRLWLDAVTVQSRLEQEVKAAKEVCEGALNEERIADAQRVLAEQEEADLRAAREKAEADELQADEDEETRRLAEVAESIRRMRELQRLEEEDRLAKEKQAETERRTDGERRKEERRLQEEELRRAKLEQIRLAREQREREAREKQEREERAQRQAEEEQHRYEQAAAKEKTRCLKRDQNPRPWTPCLAVMHFKTVSAEFDDIRFCDTQPLTFESVPWPLLHTPEQRSLDAVEWGAVEAFFVEVKNLLDFNEYKHLVEKTHRRFHPDKWKARGLLNTVLNGVLRERLEAAGNIVAQAMTPIWMKSKSTS